MTEMKLFVNVPKKKNVIAVSFFKVDLLHFLQLPISQGWPVSLTRIYKGCHLDAPWLGKLEAWVWHHSRGSHGGGYLSLIHI